MHTLHVTTDDVSAIALTNSPLFHGGTKHIEIDYHFVFEKATCKDVQINYVSTVDQIGDLPISSPNHFLTQGFGN